MKNNILKRFLPILHKLPGKYLVSEWLSRILIGNNPEVEGNIGIYNIQFDFRDLLQRQMWFGLYDTHEIALLRTILKQGDVFLDLGGNVGYYSFLASQLVGDSGHVYTFEPIQANINKILNGIARNNISNITVVQKAVSDTEGKLSLFLGENSSENSGWASILPTKMRQQAIEVDKITLDTYLAENAINRIALVKMDIEGSEFDALKGMQNLLSNAQKPVLIIELNEFLLKNRGLSARDLLAYLESFGYDFHVIRAKLSKVSADLVVKDVMNILCQAK